MSMLDRRMICTTEHIIIISGVLACLMSMPAYRYLLIKLVQYQLSPTIRPSISPVYYSFSLNPPLLKNKQNASLEQDIQLLYFSSCMPGKTVTLTDDIIVSGDVASSETLQLQRWENHMVMFSTDVDITELRSRPVLSRKVETMCGQVLKMIIIGLKDSELKIGNRLNQSITQHYLFISYMTIQNSPADTGAGPSYFSIRTEQQQYMIPVMDSKIVIKIPDTFEFSHIKNSKCVSKSDDCNFSKLQLQPCIIPLQAVAGSKMDEKLTMDLQWGINLLQIRPQSSLLLDSQEINIYDVQIKLDITDVSGLKVKLVNGNKGFQLGAQFSNGKSSVTKIRKIINFVAKSDEEQVVVLFEKNLKTIAITKIQIQEIIPFTVHTIKRKMTDMSGKPFGSLKFKCEKAKTLSGPNNNKFWRQSSKTTKSMSNLLVAFDQLSVKYQFNQQIILSLKTETEEKIVKKIPNFKYFNQNLQVSKSIFPFNLKPQQSIYMVLRRANSDESDFIGIAVFNPSTVRLGQSFIQITFFKNQMETIVLNCQVNKVVAYPFIKHAFQPELLQSSSHRSISLSIVLRQIQLSPYFYTFRYENKNEVYSIVEVNRNKKVLILENKNKSNQLSFNCSASSDNLDFCIEETEIIKVKITFLVSDLGQNQEIYGWATVKFKLNELEAANPILKFYLVEIKNDFGSSLGQINLEVHKAALFNSHEKQSRDILQSSSRAAEGEKRKLKMHLAQISQSVELKQKDKAQEPTRVQSKSINVRKGLIEQIIPEFKKPSVRYEKMTPLFTEEPKRKNNSVLDIEKKLKLPAIRQQSASPQGKKSYNELVHMMKIRRRSTKGHYEQNSMLESYQLKDYNHRSILKSGKFDDTSTETVHLKEKIEKQNPNLSRNMEILFPKKNSRLDKNISYKRPISEEQKKFKGLKSVLNQISSDMGEIEPTVKDEQKQAQREKVEQKVHYSDEQAYHLQGPEWTDNEFAV